MSDAEVDELLSWVRDYANTRIDFRLQDERRCVQPHVVLDLGRKGILGGLGVPKAYGGLALTPRQVARTAEQLGAIDLGLTAWIGQNNWLGVQPIVDAGTDKQKEEFLPALATGRMLGSFALTERAAGSDPNAIQTTISQTSADTFRLSGEKSWIGNASWAGVVNVFAKQVDSDGRALGFTGCLVRPGTPGYVIGPELLTMGLRTGVQNRITFEDVQVPRSDLLGEPLGGFATMHRAMQRTRIGIGGASLGGMRRCLSFQHRYSSRRKTSRGLLKDYPAVVLALNTGVAKIETLATAVDQLARLEESLPVGAIPDQLHMCIKVAASEFLWEMADQTVQLLGARGYTESNEAPRFLRDARVFRVFEGPTETLDVFVGALSGGPKFYAFLRDELGVAAVAQRLKDAVAEIRNRKSYFDGLLGADSQQLLHSLIGPVLRWGILLAFVTRHADPGRSKWTQLSRDWTELHFEQALARALEPRWERRLACKMEDIDELLRNSPVTDLAPFQIGEVHDMEPELL
jgi:alkylation response protein AidB-like acyl-CoA dehydrogenase